MQYRSEDILFFYLKSIFLILFCKPLLIFSLYYVIIYNRLIPFQENKFKRTMKNVAYILYIVLIIDINTYILR